jgi:hypothetical protein
VEEGEVSRYHLVVVEEGEEFRYHFVVEKRNFGHLVAVVALDKKDFYGV